MKENNVDYEFEMVLDETLGFNVPRWMIDMREKKAPAVTQPVHLDYDAYKARKWNEKYGYDKAYEDRPKNPYNEMQQQALIASGARVWQGGGYHRLYFYPSFIGLRKDEQGNWTFKGKTKEEAKKLKQDLWYAYLDLDDRRLIATQEIRGMVEKVIDDVLRQYPDAKTA